MKYDRRAANAVVAGHLRDVVHKEPMSTVPIEGPTDLIVLVYVHGFKGNEVTFESFPDRVAHLLQESIPSVRVESRVFPAYETRGDLTSAVERFVDWLTTLVIDLEVNHGAGGGMGKARVVLCGHSMGGLLIADAAINIAKHTRDDQVMWPRIVAVLAFDTPYLGLHPNNFKHHLEKAHGVASQISSLAQLAPALAPVSLAAFGWGAKSTPKAGEPSRSGSSTPTATSSGWGRLATMGAVALGAAAAGTAYYRREDFVNGWKWGSEHMRFVGNLWDTKAMEGRMVDMAELVQARGIGFRNFYTIIPSGGSYTSARTFTRLPPTRHPLHAYFLPATNTLAKDEVEAHMGMFAAKTNPGFYELGLDTLRAIGLGIEAGVEEDRQVKSEVEVSVKVEEGRQRFREEKRSDGTTVLIEDD